ncbi:MAG: hypothetical protein IJ785_08805 [Bacteroidales bacterium]|nr:hypothetical protein [Bacteroidales bacterium]
MNTHRTRKKNLIVSYKNLSEQLKELFKEHYPDGYTEYLQRFEKPNGETIFVVPMETEDTVYMIKFDVKIDTTYTDEDTEKDFFDEEVEKAENQFAPLQEAIEQEEGDPTHKERNVRHGSYDDSMENGKKRTVEHGALGALGAELQEAFSDENDDEDYDDYADSDSRESDDPDDEYEPTDEELMDVDGEVFANAEIPPEELARMAAEELVANEKAQQKAAETEEKPKRPGRPRKSEEDEPAEPKKKGRPRIKNN